LPESAGNGKVMIPHSANGQGTKETIRWNNLQEAVQEFHQSRGFDNLQIEKSGSVEYPHPG